jgi:hypothetical protein
LDVEGTVYAPDGETVPVRLRQTAPGRYETQVDASASGNYVVALSPRRGNRRLAPVIGGASQSASPEFNRFQSNAALLDEIADMTGGRRLDVATPQAADLFDRSGMAPSVAALPAWQAVLWIALALLLLDVASRRIAWGSAQLWALARQAAARVAPGRVRGQAAAATLASLRNISVQVGRQRLARTEPPPRPRPSAPRTRRAKPEESGVAAAIDALRGKQTEPETPKEQQEAPPEATGSTETTSSLLEAKRRARKKMGSELE